MTQEKLDLAFNNRWRVKGEFMSNDKRIMAINGLFENIKHICRDFFEAGIVLGQSETTGLPTKVIHAGLPDNIEIRSINFFQTIYTSSNVQKYGNQMLQDFYEYWSEQNPSHTKMRFELQKTWDVNRRLARWARNNFNNYGTDKQSQRNQRFAEVAERIAEYTKDPE